MSDETRDGHFPAAPPGVRQRRPAPQFADAPWVHAAIGAPVGASIAFVLQSPPRGAIDHLVIGAIGGAVLAVALGALRPESSGAPEAEETRDAPACDDSGEDDRVERSD